VANADVFSTPLLSHLFSHLRKSIAEGKEEQKDKDKEKEKEKDKDKKDEDDKKKRTTSFSLFRKGDKGSTATLKKDKRQSVLGNLAFESEAGKGLVSLLDF